MAEDWLADVRKYVADADEAVVSAIVKYLGIALRNRDSSLVSFTDKKETDRVRENFLKKKLGLTDDDATLDAAIANVGEQMKGDRTRNRVTVYYLLARHFGLLTLFGGAAGAVGGAGAAAAMAAVGGVDGDAPKEDPSASAAPLAAAGLAGASAAAPAAATSPPAATPVDPAPPAASPQQAYSGGTGDIGSSGDSGGGMGWLGWLLLALVLAALLFFGLRYCSKQDTAVAPATDDTAISETVAPGDGTVDTTGATGTASAAAIPAGAGVVAADREGKPMLTVYFDTGKSEVSNDLTTAASSVKAYFDANPAATLAVSGYNDPTGNAAANAELSKNRAQSVKAALEKLGFAADRVVLEKPAEATTTGTDNSAARRVEVTVKG